MKWKQFLNELLTGGRKVMRGADPKTGASKTVKALKVDRRGGGALLRARGLPEICAIADRFLDPDAPPDAPLQRQRGRLAERRARTLIRAMVLAANADGHVDAKERKLLGKKLNVLGDEAQEFFETELKRNRRAAMGVILDEVAGPREAYEIYILSALVCADVSPPERRFLKTFAKQLGVGADIAKAIEAEVRRYAA
ncbi:MAG: DUF533 domain-containing protein [Pseudomonadota bacterium]